MATKLKRRLSMLLAAAMLFGLLGGAPMAAQAGKAPLTQLTPLMAQEPQALLTQLTPQAAPGAQAGQAEPNAPNAPSAQAGQAAQSAQSTQSAQVGQVPLAAQAADMQALIGRIFPKENIYRVELENFVVFGVDNTKKLTFFISNKLPCLRLRAFKKQLKNAKYKAGACDVHKIAAALEKYRV